MTWTPAQARIVALADALASRFAARAPGHDAASSFPHENWQDLHESAVGAHLLRAPIGLGVALI